MWDFPLSVMLSLPSTLDVESKTSGIHLRSLWDHFIRGQHEYATSTVITVGSLGSESSVAPSDADSAALGW